MDLTDPFVFFFLFVDEKVEKTMYFCLFLSFLTPYFLIFA